MGFGSKIGKLAGKVAAQMQEAVQYKSEYEYMSDRELRTEYVLLKAKSGTEYKLRRIAIQSVLQDRGQDIS